MTHPPEKGDREGREGALRERRAHADRESPADADRERPIGGVLVGGASRRYGRSKPEVPVGGVSMLERALRALQPHASPLYLAGRSMALPTAPDGVGSSTLAALLPDIRPDAGPLAGVEALLQEADARGSVGALVLPCDLPLVDAELMGLVARESTADPDRPIVTAGPAPGDVHPLCGYWPATALGALEELLDRGERAAREACRTLEARVLGPSELAAVADPTRAFLNVNTPAARERAEALLAVR